MQSCPFCLVPGEDDGDGLCTACGHRLSSRPIAPPVPSGISVTPPQGARRLVEVGPELTVDAVTGLAHQLLDVAGRFEAAGSSWRPIPADFAVDGAGRLHLFEARGVWKLEGAARFEVELPLLAFGTCVTPLPVVFGSPRLVRLFAFHREVSRRRMTRVDEARRELALAERDLPLPTGESAAIGTASDEGLRRERNEDAVETASGVGRDGEPWAVLVVCDGVARSTRARAAATVAAKTARSALERYAAQGGAPGEPSRAAAVLAIRSAHHAVCAQTFDRTRGEPPGTTIVCALVHRGAATVAWVGDSRAYWLARDGVELLTRDHSWVNEVVAAGAMTESEALRHPLAHALTRCLGPVDGTGSSSEVQPDVITCALSGAGQLVLCSDGLWTYYRDASSLARLIGTAGEGAGAARIARHLVNSALARGGADNVSVAVYTHDG